jgi:hypothetical protein
MDTLVLVVVTPHFAALHLVSRLHNVCVARTAPLCLSGEPLMLRFACWHFHLSFCRLAGALSTAGDLCLQSDPRPRRRGLTLDKTALLCTLSAP